MFLVVGSTTVDLFVRSDRLPSGGPEDGFRAANLLFTEQPLLALLGGNGGCSAYALAALGAPVALYSAVGQDALGALLTAWLAERGVRLDGCLRSADHATSSSTVLLHPDGRQLVYHHLGATAAIAPGPALDALVASASVLLATGYTLATAMRPAGFAALLASVYRRGALTALDIGPALGEPVSLAELEPLLPHVDLLLANRHELAACTGYAEKEWERATAALHAAGAARVVVKLGADGAALRGIERADAPGFPTAAHVTAGAGDVFNSALLYAYRRGDALPAALRFANAAAALTVASPQGILGAPGTAQVETFLAI